MNIACFVCKLKVELTDTTSVTGWGTVPYREDATVYICPKHCQEFVGRNAERDAALTEANEEHRKKWIDPYYKESWDLLDEIAGEQSSETVVKFPKPRVVE